jgi:hypothetical protein
MGSRAESPAVPRWADSQEERRGMIWTSLNSRSVALELTRWFPVESRPDWTLPLEFPHVRHNEGRRPVGHRIGARPGTIRGNEGS